MSGKNRKFRRREEVQEESEDDGNLGQPQVAAPVALKAKQKDKPPSR